MAAPEDPSTNEHTLGRKLRSWTERVQSAAPFVVKLSNDGVLNLACIIAYNMLMAMLPIALALLAILSLFLGDVRIRFTVVHQITLLFPGLANQQNALELASQQLHQASGFFGFVALIFGVSFGSFLFVVMEWCLDIVYCVRQRPFVRQFALATGMLLVFVLLIPLIVGVSVAPAILFSRVATLPLLSGLHGGSKIVLSLAGLLGGTVAAFGLFESIYLVVPNHRVSWRTSWPGAAVAAVATELFLALFPLMVPHVLGGYAGPVGFAVILLLFFYYFALILLVGAEINAFFFSGVRPLPSDLVTFISTRAGASTYDRPRHDRPPIESSALGDPRQPVAAADGEPITGARRPLERTVRQRTAQRARRGLRVRQREANSSSGRTRQTRRRR